MIGLNDINLGGYTSSEIAKACYEGYCFYTNGKSLVTGDNLPQFEDLSEDLKKAWYYAGASVKELLTWNR